MRLTSAFRSNSIRLSGAWNASRNAGTKRNASERTRKKRLINRVLRMGGLRSLEKFWGGELYRVAQKLQARPAGEARIVRRGTFKMFGFAVVQCIQEKLLV